MRATYLVTWGSSGTNSDSTKVLLTGLYRIEAIERGWVGGGGGGLGAEGSSGLGWGAALKG